MDLVWRATERRLRAGRVWGWATRTRGCEGLVRERKESDTTEEWNVVEVAGRPEDPTRLKAAHCLIRPQDCEVDDPALDANNAL